MATFWTGKKIAEDGIYFVHHLQHELVRTVTLAKDDMFPRCSQCSIPVTFELLLPLPGMLGPATKRISELPLRPSDEIGV